MELMKYAHQYELYIIDMDGTLYYQSKLRRKMCALMIKELFTNRVSLIELYTVFMFRKLREEQAGKAYSDDELYRKVAQKVPGCLRPDAEAVEKNVTKWIYDRPLDILNECKDECLINFIRGVISTGKKVYIYSDYPAEAKAKALGSDVFADKNIKYVDASTEGIGVYKPCSKGIGYILQEAGTAPDMALMIGDRDDRDGVAAKKAGIDVLILNKKSGKRYI
jgi:HAD superfamily hydrolase (TIGR01549 family)